MRIISENPRAKTQAPKSSATRWRWCRAKPNWLDATSHRTAQKLTINLRIKPYCKAARRPGSLSIVSMARWNTDEIAEPPLYMAA